LVLLLALLVVLTVISGVFSKGERSVETGLQGIENAKLATFETDQRILAAAIQSYLVDHGEYPDSLESLRPTYTRADLIDPWGTQYTLEIGSTTASLISAGRDKTFGTPDDLRRRLR